MLLNWLARVAPKLSGVMVLAIGTAHFAMPEFGYSSGAIAAVPDAQRDHFVYLGTYAIGTFLVSFAILTLLADLRNPSVLETVFFGMMSVVWGVRFALELIYPVTLSLFFLSDPHHVLLGAILLIWAGYIVALIVAVLRLRYERVIR